MLACAVVEIHVAHRKILGGHDSGCVISDFAFYQTCYNTVIFKHLTIDP